MSTITITVQGSTGTGKTTLCQIIGEVLRARGIKVSSLPPELTAETNFVEMRDVRQLEAALRTLGEEGLEVHIVEKQALKARS